MGYRGRNSKVIGIRLPIEVIAVIKSYLKEGETEGLWVRDRIIQLINATDLGAKTGSRIQTHADDVIGYWVKKD